jgi:MscS family membrane protein
VIDVTLSRLAEKTESKLDDMIVPMVRKTLRIFLVIVFTIVMLQNVFNLNITGFLASLGIAGLAVSLAAQDSVKNLFGSLTVFFDKPFMVGDYISFVGNTGTVEEIGFRSTRIRLRSGHLVSVPNMKFIDNDVENITARPYIRREMNVTITYDTPPDNIEKAVDILHDVLNDPQVVEQGKFDMEDFPPRLAFNELNADSLNIRAYYWYQMAGDPDRGFFSYLTHSQIVNMKLFRAYGEAGIEFAFPTQTLYLAGDPARKLSVDARLIGGDTAGKAYT